MSTSVSVDFVLHAPDRLLAIEAKAGQRVHRTDARPFAEALGALAARGMARNAWRLGLIVTRGREVEPLAPGVRAIPDWRLFGPVDQIRGHPGHVFGQGRAHRSRLREDER